MIDSENKVLFARLKETAVLPSKREEDAGYDIYPCFEEEEIIILPHETAVISTGIATAFPSNIVAVIKERGSTGKMGFGQRGGVYDSGFRGEWTVSITNHNDKRIIISKNSETLKRQNNDIVYPYGKAIAQILFVPLAELSAVEVDEKTLLSVKSERGIGRFGSSNK